MKRSVGLILLTYLDDKLTAVLHARGVFNPETMKAESWPGACQVTTHGRYEDVDQGNPIAALVREATDELGDAIALLIRERFADLHQAGYKKDEQEEATTYSLLLPDPRFLKYVRLPAETGGLRFAHWGDERLCNMKTGGYTKTDGILSRNVFALFPDELDAVHKALAMYPETPRKA
jgi:hypothetical protein